jgi:hypothetical protein
MWLYMAIQDNSVIIGISKVAFSAGVVLLPDSHLSKNNNMRNAT